MASFSSISSERGTDGWSVICCYVAIQDAGTRELSEKNTTEAYVASRGLDVEAEREECDAASPNAGGAFLKRNCVASFHQRGPTTPISPISKGTTTPHAVSVEASSAYTTELVTQQAECGAVAAGISPPGVAALAAAVPCISGPPLDFGHNSSPAYFSNTAHTMSGDAYEKLTLSQPLVAHGAGAWATAPILLAPSSVSSGPTTTTPRTTPFPSLGSIRAREHIIAESEYNDQIPHKPGYSTPTRTSVVELLPARNANSVAADAEAAAHNTIPSFAAVKCAGADCGSRRDSVSTAPSATNHSSSPPSDSDSCAIRSFTRANYGRLSLTERTLEAPSDTPRAAVFAEKLFAVGVPCQAYKPGSLGVKKSLPDSESIHDILDARVQQETALVLKSGGALAVEEKKESQNHVACSVPPVAESEVLLPCLPFSDFNLPPAATAAAAAASLSIPTRTLLSGTADIRGIQGAQSTSKTVPERVPPSKALVTDPVPTAFVRPAPHPTPASSALSKPEFSHTTSSSTGSLSSGASNGDLKASLAGPNMAEVSQNISSIPGSQHDAPVTASSQCTCGVASYHEVSPASLAPAATLARKPKLYKHFSALELEGASAAVNSIAASPSPHSTDSTSVTPLESAPSAARLSLGSSPTPAPLKAHPSQTPPTAEKSPQLLLSSEQSSPAIGEQDPFYGMNPSAEVAWSEICFETSSPCLGDGNEGDVLLARLKDTLVAVKVGTHERIVREQKLVAKLSHPHVLRTLGHANRANFELQTREYLHRTLADSNSDDLCLSQSPLDDTWGLRCTPSTTPSPPPLSSPNGNYAAIYEYCANKDLMTYLSISDARTNVAKMTQILDDILAGLEYIHEHHPNRSIDGPIVHGDVKPENIMIDHEGRAKLGDFGLAQFQSSNMDVQGTPSYIAPEVVLDFLAGSSHPNFTTKADIFSFGVLMVVALTGHYPFKRLTAKLHSGQMSAAQVIKHFTPSRRALKTISDLSPRFKRMVDSCLCRYPEMRPTAAQLRNVLFKRSNTTASIARNPTPDTTQIPRSAEVISAPQTTPITSCANSGRDFQQKSSDNPTTNNDCSKIPSSLSLLFLGPAVTAPLIAIPVSSGKYGE